MSDYTPQANTAYRPFLGGSPVDDSVTDPPAPLHFRTFKLPASDPEVALYGAGGVIGWEVKVDDLRGGYLQTGDFARGANELDGDYRMTSRSTLEQRFRRHLALPGVTVRTARGSGGYHPFTATHLGTTLYLSRSDQATNNVALWREDTGGTLTLLAFSPVSIAAAMAPIVIGGATQPERLLHMGHAGSYVVSSAGVLDGTMHSNLFPSFGMLTSPINATDPGTGTHLFYANNGIWALPLTAAIGAAPVQVLFNVPNGGYAIGVEKLLKGPLGLRAYWAWPKDDRGVLSVMDSSGVAPPPQVLMSTNLEGTDPLPVSLPLMWISYSCLWRRNLVAADPVRIVLHDGETSRDLHILANRQAFRGKYQVCGLLTNDNDLFALVAKFEYPGSAVAQEVWIEQFLPQFDAWVPVTGVMPYIGNVPGPAPTNPYDASNLVTAMCPRFPVSRSTGYAYLAGIGVDSPGGYSWNHTWLTPSGQNPYYLYQGTVGDTLNATTRRHVEASGVWVGPYIELPKLEGRWKRADQVVFLGDVDNANADCYVDISLNGDTPVRFAPGQPHIAQLGETGSAALFTQLQLSITIGRGSFEYKTPNALPVLVRGRAYLADPEQFVLGVPTGP